MSVAFNAASQGNGTNTASVSIAHTPAGQSRLLVFAIAYLDVLITGVSMATPTFAGIPLVQVGTTQIAGATSLSVWRMSAPPASAGFLTTTFDSNVNFVAEVLSYTGVHQTVPTGTPVAATGSLAAVGVTVPGTVDGGMVVDGVTVELGATTTTAAVHGGQNERANAFVGSSGFRVRLLASDDDGGGDANMAWTLSGSRPWAQLGFELRPAPSGAVSARSGGLSGIKRLGKTRGQG